MQARLASLARAICGVRVRTRTCLVTGPVCKAHRISASASRSNCFRASAARSSAGLIDTSEKPRVKAHRCTGNFQGRGHNRTSDDTGACACLVQLAHAFQDATQKPAGCTAALCRGSRDSRVSCRRWLLLECWAFERRCRTWCGHQTAPDARVGPGLILFMRGPLQSGLPLEFQLC